MLIRQDDDHALLELHDHATGQPVLLRQKFMIVAFRAGGKDSTEITMDGLRANHLYHVRETPAEISGPFVKLGNVTFNPDYFLGFCRNTHSDQDPHRFSYRLRGNPAISFSTSWTAEQIKGAMQKARMPRL